MNTDKITFQTHGDTRFDIRVWQGGNGPELLYLHGAGGLLANDPWLAALEQHFHVTAPLLPGYEDSQGSEHLREMLDFTLHAYDVWDALQLEHPLVVGHSMGGMLAAEMAALAPDRIAQLVLLAPVGLWRDEMPVTDLFATLPYELPELLFHDPDQHAGLLSAGGDLDDPEYLTEFMVANSQRMGTAAKLLFPVPDRGLEQRLYRVRAHTTIVWGAQDRIIDPRYAQLFGASVPDANLIELDETGHMVPYEQTAEVVQILQNLTE